MRVYISGGISGYPDLNRPAFDAAQDALKGHGYEVVNPFEVTTSTDWHTCMKDDIKALLSCDGVATLDGWERSRGAKIEIGLAMKLDMPVRPVAEWLREVAL